MDSSLRKTGVTSKIAAILAVALVVCGLCVSAAAAGNDKYANAAELKLMQGFPPPPDKRVTRKNALLTPPFNRWSYLHMRMIYPSAPIPAAYEAIPLTRKIDSGIEGVKVLNPGTKKMVDMATYLRETSPSAGCSG